MPRRLSKADAARRGFLLIVALGSLLEVRREDGRPVGLESEWERIGMALTAPDAIQTVPEVHFEHWDGAFDFDTGDGLLDRLLEATRDEIGRRGYEATTVDDIARAAGRTKGLVFSRYPSKKQLFNDTVTRYTKGMYDLNEQAWNQMQATASAGAAEAVLYRELMRPGREHLRGFPLEQYRLSWHDPYMSASVAHAMSDVVAARMDADATRSRPDLQAEVFVGVAQGVGVLLMASVYPDAWKLPYQHITIPLNA
ncbi:MAG: helix-turn-helix domain-containing protein [bacterium]